MQLRVHHILCVPLFVGKGYSERFVDNMQTIVDRLKENVTVTLQVEPDVICSDCPNYQKQQQQCVLDQNHVKTKDTALAERLSLDLTRKYMARDLFKEVEKKMTEEIFSDSCKCCSWYAQGLCDYQKYATAIRRFT